MGEVVYHDYFAIRGGGERLVLDLANGLGCDLVFGYRQAESYELAEFPARSRSLGFEVGRWPRGIRTLGLALTFVREQGHAARYSTRIFSGVMAPFAAPPKSAPGRNIFYCHTPPRYFYDLRAHYERNSDPLRRLGLLLLGPALRRRYEEAVARMHVIVANSENVRRRIKTHLGRDSVVIYPPVDTAGFAWAEPQGYYLSTARLTPLKRVGEIVDAFLQMPDKRLVVASGGEDEAALRARAAGAGNITFTGWTSETQLRSLVAGAIATIYVPIEEDFGMSPVESMSAGKPVIGVAEGGLLETVVPGETGLLVRRGFEVADIVDAVGSLDEAAALRMRAACEARAQLFTRDRFLAAMRALVDGEGLPAAPREQAFER